MGLLELRLPGNCERRPVTYLCWAGSRPELPLSVMRLAAVCLLELPLRLPLWTSTMPCT
jgi:hypothetical protein